MVSYFRDDCQIGTKRFYSINLELNINLITASVKCLFCLAVITPSQIVNLFFFLEAGVLYEL